MINFTTSVNFTPRGLLFDNKRIVSELRLCAIAYSYCSEEEWKKFVSLLANKISDNKILDFLHEDPIKIKSLEFLSLFVDIDKDNIRALSLDTEYNLITLEIPFSFDEESFVKRFKESEESK